MISTPVFHPCFIVEKIPDCIQNIPAQLLSLSRGLTSHYGVPKVHKQLVGYLPAPSLTGNKTGLGAFPSVDRLIGLMIYYGVSIFGTNATA